MCLDLKDLDIYKVSDFITKALDYLMNTTVFNNHPLYDFFILVLTLASKVDFSQEILFEWKSENSPTDNVYLFDSTVLLFTPLNVKGDITKIKMNDIIFSGIQQNGTSFILNSSDDFVIFNEEELFSYIFSFIIVYMILDGSLGLKNNASEVDDIRHTLFLYYDFLNVESPVENVDKVWCGLKHMKFINGKTLNHKYDFLFSPYEFRILRGNMIYLVEDKKGFRNFNWCKRRILRPGVYRGKSIYGNDKFIDSASLGDFLKK